MCVAGNVDQAIAQWAWTIARTLPIIIMSFASGREVMMAAKFCGRGFVAALNANALVLCEKHVYMIDL